MAREPPDGCEKVCFIINCAFKLPNFVKMGANCSQVNLKFTECVASGVKPVVDIYPIKPSIGFQLRPSLGSAFQPLQPPTPTESPPSPVKMNLASLTSADD